MRKLLIIAALMISGCSSNLPLSGRVVYTDDGSPLEKGVVCFETPTLMARGEIGEDGKYSVGIIKRQDGIPKGTYNVYISGTEEGSTLLIDKKFANPQTSGLTFVVDGKSNTFDFAVDRSIPKKKTKLKALNASESE
jgi:hypothetical protein